MDERALLKAARRLDSDALAQIHRLYYDSLYRYIVLRVSDQATAEDLTSEVFTRLLEALHRGRAPRQTLRGWLYQVASNVVADHFRRDYRAPQVQLEDDLPTDDTGPLGKVIKGLRTAQLLDAVGELTEEQQQVLALRFGAGLSIKETAAQMEKSVGAVKMLQARAVDRLSQLITGGG